MIERPTVQQLTGDRLHLAHGPIDIVLRAFGSPTAVAVAERAATVRFSTILAELAAELGELRRPMDERPIAITWPARSMVIACRPHGDEFITPMAAVAGAVADELLAAMVAAAPALDRAYVNNGGDIAVHLAPGTTLALAVVGTYAHGDGPGRTGDIRISAGDGIGGVATSGARGRSFSRGIADSVTVLASTAAAADAAATLVANAVDVEAGCDDPRVTRRRACDLDPDNCLGHRLVTTAVAPLDRDTVASALKRGVARAENFLCRGLIAGAVVTLQGQTRVVTAAGIQLGAGVATTPAVCRVTGA